MRVTVDLDALSSELSELDEAVLEAERQVEKAQASLAAAKRRKAELQEFVDRLRSYAEVPGGESGNETAGQLPPGSLDGMSGTKAALAYVEMNPGLIEKLEDSYENMCKLGFNGTLNAVQVAFSNMSKDGAVERRKRGVYRFPEPGSDRGGSESEELADSDDVPFDDRSTATSASQLSATSVTGS